MKVCMATEFYPTSGTRVIQDEIRWLRKMGVEAFAFTSQHDILANKRHSKMLHEEELIYFTPSILVPQIPYAICPLAPYDLAKVIAKEKVDVLHAHVFPMYMISNLSTLVKTASKVPLVVTFHGLHFEGYVNQLYRHLMHAYYASYFRFLCSKADSICVLGRRSAQNAIRFGADSSKIVVIPNGVDTHRFNPCNRERETDGFTVINVGRLDYNKGVFTLLRAAVLLQKRYQDKIRFVFLGDGPQRERLLDTVGRVEGLRRTVKLLGYVRDVKNFLMNADVFVLPSYYEGLPISLLEAMACAKPVIATNVGDVPDVVKNEFNGLLIEPGSPEAIANAIEKLLNDSQYAKELGVRGYETVKESFDIEVVCRKLKSVYEKVCMHVD